MKDSLSLKQYQLISAYIDGRCSPREKAQVESLLETNAEFKQAVAEFSRCKKMFSVLPRVRAPRNFTLTPALAPHKPQRFFPVPILNYAALTAAVLCVILFAGSSFLPFGNSQKSIERAAPMLAAVSDQTVTEATATPVPLITWGIGGAEGKGGGGGIGGGPVSALNSEAEGTSSTETSPLVTEAPLAESYMAATAEPTQSAESYGIAAASDTSNVILGIAPSDEQGKELTQEPISAPLPVSIPSPVSWVQLTEIGLAVVAVSCALIAFIIRKRH